MTIFPWHRSDTWSGVSIFKPIYDLDHAIVDAVAQVVAPFGGGSTLGYANMVTYRNKDVMLSSVQDYNSKYAQYHFLMYYLRSK